MKEEQRVTTNKPDVYNALDAKDKINDALGVLEVIAGTDASTDAIKRAVNAALTVIYENFDTLEKFVDAAREAETAYRMGYQAAQGK